MHYPKVNDELYCKIFIDALIDLDNLNRLITKFISGKPEFPYWTHNDYLDIEISNNSETDNQKKKNLDNGFLFYPFYLEVTGTEIISEETYKLHLKNLIDFLRNQGFKVIPVTNEASDELNNGKHYSEFMK